MRLGRYIHGKLTADAALAALVGDRVYPVLMPMKAEYPAIVYTVANAPLDRNMKDRPADHDSAKVSFHIWADMQGGQQNYDTLDDIDTALRAALDFAAEEEVGGVTVESCKYAGGRDGYDEGRTLYLRESNYDFTVKN